MMQILKQYGYPDSEILILHKQWKSDKQIFGRFVSSVLYVVVAYKDKPHLSGLSSCSLRGKVKVAPEPLDAYQSYKGPGG